MSDEQSFDEHDLRSLGEKLAALDLTDRERAAMAALLAEDDVGGYGTRFDIVGGVRKGFLETGEVRDWFTRQGPHGLRSDDTGGSQGFRPGRF